MTEVGFWFRDCPMRGPALKHHHEQNCTDGHSYSQCCFCGESYTAVAIAPAPMPPLDVQARLTALGMIPPTAPTAEPEHKDDTVVEPKAITGNGPTGPVDSRGRGGLTKRLEERLIARAGWQDWLDAHPERSVWYLNEP
jgi:hypothetical protein